MRKVNTDLFPKIPFQTNRLVYATTLLLLCSSLVSYDLILVEPTLLQCFVAEADRPSNQVTEAISLTTTRSLVVGDTGVQELRFGNKSVNFLAHFILLSPILVLISNYFLIFPPVTS